MDPSSARTTIIDLLLWIGNTVTEALSDDVASTNSGNFSKLTEYSFTAGSKFSKTLPSSFISFKVFVALTFS